MKLTPIASNMTEVQTAQYDVLFSYSTPVAAHDRTTGAWYRTAQWYSKTTSRHIHKWIGPDATEKPQSFFDALV